jgi:DNA-binding LacI/PurR family transcriptional regulator
MSESPPTVRSIAAKAGVSATTVALALKNAPRIPPATRKRIQAIAKNAGYRPDPAVRKLMLHLRTRREHRLRANIAVLVPHPSAPQYFSASLLNGIKTRAQNLGYAVSTLPFLNRRPDIVALQRMLRSRGIEGVIFAPLELPQALDAGFDFSDLSVVAATSSVLHPRFHAVMPNHYDNMIMACESLARIALTKIGLAISQNHDERVRHRTAGAIAWNMLFKKTPMAAPLVAREMSDSDIFAWLKNEQPDAVVADHDFERRLAALLPLAPHPATKLITLNWPSRFTPLGIDQRETEIGVAAVDVLSGMIERGEKGIPRNPRVTMIDGRWRP